jgi:choline-sulfatase
MDLQIGRILAELKTNGYLENTLVIFTSDHGDYLGQYGLFLKHPNIPYDPLAKVPLIIGGAKVVSGTRWNGLTSLVDLLPTIIEMTGAEFPGFTQGVSLTPILSGTAAHLHRAVFCETNAVKAVRTSDYKYIYSPQGPTDELYYLPEDPDELNNIAGENRAVVEEHRRMLDWMIQSSWNRS